MSQPYFESANVNDILSVARKQTVAAKMLNPRLSYDQHEWVPYYQNDATNPTLFKQEVYGSPVLATPNDKWPASISAEDNPYGITAVQGEDILTPEEKALWKFGDLSYDGWTEIYDIKL